MADNYLVTHFRLPIAQRRQQRALFEDSIISDDAIINALRADFVSLCAVCTTPLELRDARPHRWRPAQGAIGASGDASAEHYYWLAYEWSNLYLLCLPCAEAQGQKFPVAGRRARLGSKDAELLRELPLLLDPCADDPEQHLLYSRDGLVLARDERGAATIDVFALNRSELVNRRREAIDVADLISREMIKALDRAEYMLASDLIVRGYQTDVPFAAAIRQFVNQRAQFRRAMVDRALTAAGISFEGLVGALPRVTTRDYQQTNGRRLESARARADLDPRERDAVGTRTVGLERVHIENFKNIRELEIRFARESPIGQWTMLIGENGAGKSSILQALALTLIGGDISPRLQSPKTFLTRSQRKGRVEVTLAGTEGSFSMDYGTGGRIHFEAPFPVAVAAYGASRLPHVASAKRPEYRSATVENLFDPYASLLSPTRWANDLGPDRQSSVLQSVEAALQLDPDDELYFTKSGSLRIRHASGQTFALSELSSGYQAVGALALDLARIFVSDWSSLQDAEGLVLLDEVETHLHPRWQMRIVSALRTAFPRVQFVASTHSPLCLRGLKDGEVQVLRTGSGLQDQWLDTDLPALAGLSADQLLTSEIFNLHSTLDLSMQLTFERYYYLLAERRRTEDEELELTSLRETLKTHRQLGTTRREAMVLEAVDEFLARETLAESQSASSDLEAAAKDEISRIWSGL